MQQPSSHNKSNDLHWMCGNLPINGTSKLNLAEFYKKDKHATNKTRWCINESRGQLLSFETKGPYIYHLYTPLEQDPKCLALDLFFKEPATVAKIRFQNHYVAFLSLLAKVVGHRNWETVIQHKELMPSPHFETGSRLYFELKPSGTQEWTQITELRFVLHQSSPCWKKFFIENISAYREENANANAGTYLINLIKQTEEALNMERRNEKQINTTGSNGSFCLGKCGYVIDKLPEF